MKPKNEAEKKKFHRIQLKGFFALYFFFFFSPHFNLSTNLKNKKFFFQRILKKIKKKAK